MAVYPGAAAADSDLYVAKNNLSTTLNGAINSSVTSITVASTTNFPAVGYITIDAEAIKYTSTDSTHFLGCTRGADGTTAASHADLTNVYHNVVADHHNVLKNEIEAVESDLVGGLPVARGGTASITALNSNRFMVSSGGKIVEQSAILPARVVCTDGNGLPTAANADCSMNSHKITSLANGAASSDAAAFGQVNLLSAPLQATSSTIKSTTSTSYVDTNVSQVITPSSSSSRVRIKVSGVLANNNVTGTGVTFLTIARNGTDLSAGNGFAAIETRTNGETPVAFEYIDSPATTGATTYTARIKVDNASNTGSFGDTNVTQVLIVEEIR